MAQLKWKRLDRGREREHEARASDGGKYRILNYGSGFSVRYCPPHRRWWPLVGNAVSELEAAALAQADNDKKLTAAMMPENA